MKLQAAWTLLAADLQKDFTISDKFERGLSENIFTGRLAPRQSDDSRWNCRGRMWCAAVFLGCRFTRYGEGVVVCGGPSVGHLVHNNIARLLDAANADQSVCTTSDVGSL